MSATNCDLCARPGGEKVQVAPGGIWRHPQRGWLRPPSERERKRGFKRGVSALEPPSRYVSLASVTVTTWSIDGVELDLCECCVIDLGQQATRPRPPGEPDPDPAPGQRSLF